jgi:hypothetical protein
MSCVHLRRLYQLCEDEDIKLAGTDLLHIVCTQCGVKETCPAMLMDEFDPDETSQTSGDSDSDER